MGGFDSTLQRINDMTISQQLNDGLQNNTEYANTIEVGLDKELEAKIADRYGLPKMLAEFNEEPKRNIQNLDIVNAADNTLPSNLTNETQVIPDIKLHPLLDDEIPESILKRYAVKDHVYYSKSKDKGFVFEDKGKSINAKTTDPDDIRAMVDLAKSKNWSKIKISGSEDFKREVWLAASLQGIEVDGYKPSLQDMALLENAKIKTKNKIEVVNTTDGSNQKEIQKTSPAAVALVAIAEAKGAGPKVREMMKEKISVAVSQLAARGIDIPKAKIFDAKAGSITHKTATVEVDSPMLLKPIPQPKITPRR